MEGANLVLSRAPPLEPYKSFGWSGGGGATIVLEDLGADAPATVTRAEFGMCAGHGVRSPTSSKVQEACPSHGLGRGVRPLRSLRGARRPTIESPRRAGHAGAVAAPATFEVQRLSLCEGDAPACLCEGPLTVAGGVGSGYPGPSKARARVGLDIRSGFCYYQPPVAALVPVGRNAGSLASRS
jgi:hypothetical protein